MEATTSRSTLSVRIREDIKEQAKMFAKKEHRSLSNFIEFLVLNWGETHKEYKYPTSNHEPNEETLEAMKETKQGIGLSNVDTSSYEAFCASLED